MVVAVGKSAPLEANEAPQVIVLDVPLSKILIIKVCPSVGVPERLVVIEVMFVASAVIVNISTLSVFIVGVADEATVPDFLVTLLLERV